MFDFFASLFRKKRPGPNVRVLFVCRYSDNQKGSYTLDGGYPASGLFNSAKFVSDMLEENRVVSSVVHVIDNNDIDREVTRFKPTHVIVEAFWVVPEKFQVLSRLHPDVKWIIRNHSKTPFYANEGIAVDWMKKYLLIPNVYVAANSPEAYSDQQQFNDGETADKCLYLPNYYPISDISRPKLHDKWVRFCRTGELHVGCFGAIRPLKNQLMQAVAAIRWGNDNGVKIFFHINGTRVENNGNAVIRNIRALFENSVHELVEHPWVSHEEFLDVVAQMDVGMQVSYTETFNIVTADMVRMGIPVIVSPEVFWVSDYVKADPNNSSGMARVMNYTMFNTKIAKANRVALKNYSSKTTEAWLEYLAK